MKGPIHELTRLGGPAADGPLPDDQLATTLAAADASALIPLLRARNGFFAFESALRVRSAADIARWNAAALWRDAYGGLADDGTFFAEDVFGGQFCLRGGRVLAFDPETGATELVGKDVASWAAEILRDWRALTGAPLAHEWQALHGPLAPGQRLVPKVPFVLGGEFAVGNLRAMDDVQSLRYRGSIAVQIRDLPDGSPIKLVVTD